MPAYAKLILSIIAGVATLLITLGVSYFIKSDNPKHYVITLIVITALLSYLVGVLMRFIEYLTKDTDFNTYSANSASYSIGDVFVRSLFMPIMVGLLMFVFAGIPVLMNILPPKFQKFPGDGMNLLGIFRGIPESMFPAIGESALPLAEMFYAFWGGVYGLTM